MIRFRLLAAAALIALAGCHKAQPDKQAQAGGQILPGSISDAMLPLDRATSQPPLAPRTEKGPAVSESEAAAPDAGAAAPEAAPADGAKPQG
jgi:hypothetical protein